jgi:hypothetical protein
MEIKKDVTSKHYYDRQLARAYIPSQVYSQRYEPMEGLDRGTIFPELDFPYREMKWKGDYYNE